MNTRAIRGLLRLYPPAWRRRYGPEFAALLTTRPLTPSILIDVALGAVDAHRQGGRPMMVPRRWSLCGWWVLAHVALGAVALTASRTVTGRPLELLGVTLAAFLLGSAGQWLVLRRYLGGMDGWAPATMAGALLGLVLLLGTQNTRWYRGTFAADLLLLAGVCLSIGTGQWLVLRRRRPDAGWWILASGLGGISLLPAYALTLVTLRAGLGLLWRIAPGVAGAWVDLYAPAILLMQGGITALAYALVTGVALVRLYQPPGSDQRMIGPILLGP